MWGTNFCWVSYPVCGILLQQPDLRQARIELKSTKSRQWEKQVPFLNSTALCISTSCAMYSFKGYIPFYCWMIFYCMAVPYFIYPFIRWWTSGLFPFGMLSIMFIYNIYIDIWIISFGLLPIISTLLLQMCMSVLLCRHAFHFSWAYTWLELLGHRLLTFKLLQCLQTVCKTSVPFPSPVSSVMYEAFKIISAWPTLGIVWPFESSHPSAHGMKSHCSLLAIFIF